MSLRYQAGILTASYAPLKVPDAPTIGSATGGNATASVTFTAPSNPGASAITSYTAQSTPGAFTGTAVSSPITVSGLTNGTSYTFVVWATNTYGSGPNSAASNSASPVAPPSFFAFVYAASADSNNYGNYIGIDSSEYIYWTVNQFGTGNVVTKLDQSGNVQWQRLLNATYSQSAFTLSNDNLYYMYCPSGTNRTNLNRINTSGTLNLNSAFNNTSMAASAGSPRSAFTDSSGNIYAFVSAFTENCCCGRVEYGNITKYNSSGTVQWTKSRPYQSTYAATDSSGNTYAFGRAAGGGCYNSLAVVHKLDSAGTYQWSRWFQANTSAYPQAEYGAGGYNSYNGNAIVTGGVNGGGSFLAAFSTAGSGSYLWNVRLTSINSISCIAFDATTGDIYAYTTNTYTAGKNQLVIIKMNASGTVQWARSISCTTNYSFEIGGQTSISVGTGNTFQINGQLRPNLDIGVGRSAFMASLYKDGSNTGTFNVSLGPWGTVPVVYASYGVSQSTLSGTNSNGTQSWGTNSYTNGSVSNTATSTTVSITEKSLV